MSQNIPASDILRKQEYKGLIKAIDDAIPTGSDRSMFKSRVDDMVSSPEPLANERYLDLLSRVLDFRAMDMEALVAKNLSCIDLCSIFFPPDKIKYPKHSCYTPQTIDPFIAAMNTINDKVMECRYQVNGVDDIHNVVYNALMVADDKRLYDENMENMRWSPIFWEKVRKMTDCEPSDANINLLEFQTFMEESHRGNNMYFHLAEIEKEPFLIVRVNDFEIYQDMREKMSLLRRDKVGAKGEADNRYLLRLPFALGDNTCPLKELEDDIFYISERATPNALKVPEGAMGYTDSVCNCAALALKAENGRVILAHMNAMKGQKIPINTIDAQAGVIFGYMQGKGHIIDRAFYSPREDTGDIWTGNTMNCYSIRAIIRRREAVEMPEQFLVSSAGVMLGSQAWFPW